MNDYKFPVQSLISLLIAELPGHSIGDWNFSIGRFTRRIWH